MSHHNGNLDIINAYFPLRFYRDEATREKIHRHLTDINDTITEDDIRNIKIHLGPGEAKKDKDSIILKAAGKE